MEWNFSFHWTNACYISLLTMNSSIAFGAVYTTVLYSRSAHLKIGFPWKDRKKKFSHTLRNSRNKKALRNCRKAVCEAASRREQCVRHREGESSVWSSEKERAVCETEGRREQCVKQREGECSVWSSEKERALSETQRRRDLCVKQRKGKSNVWIRGDKTDKRREQCVKHREGDRRREQCAKHREGESSVWNRGKESAVCEATKRESSVWSR
jgi:hypothetical protein